MNSALLHGKKSASETGASVLAPAPARRCPPEFVLNAKIRPGEPVTAVFQRIADDLAAQEADILSVMIYGSLAARDTIDRAMRQVLGERQWPVTWIDGGSCTDAPLAGVQAFAVRSRAVTRVRLGREVVGSVYEDEGARFCLLGGLGPTAISLGVGAQVQQTLGNLEWALDAAGFALSDVIRTWFYNDDILAWYDEFNRVRSAHYASVKWRTGSLPASTGIGARNPAGAALTVAAWAMQPLGSRGTAREIASPLQCPAPAYGSSFSRAMEINSAGQRRLLISGTASIYPGGKTAWDGDAKKQIDLTMEVITAILHSREMTLSDVTRATAYFQHPLFQPYFEAWLNARDLRAMPVVNVHADVCRADLLFELELDAMARA